jgi:lysine 2,3-aminomutase
MAIAVTPEMAALIDRANLANDPIARQFVPSGQETEISAAELADPIGDDARSPVKGIVHRYPDRVLLKPLHVCPVYCRFCFRREKVGPGGEALYLALAVADGTDIGVMSLPERVPSLFPGFVKSMIFKTKDPS